MNRAFAILAPLLLAGIALSDEVDFVRDIRPILSENCAFCHGPDESTREADLRLDTREGLADVIESNAESSELFRRVISDDPDEKMPPPDSNRALTAAQIDTLKRWIDQGAQWDQHWSFLPLLRPAEPEVTSETPIRNPIDAFVQALLARDEKIEPAPEAPRTTLIRRLTLDLTGLPPTPEETAAFLRDTEPLAYERLVDRLLKSPAYGQRMAWDWLDAARYADTNGYQGDRERTMWPWRDWVVRSFNENLPFDRFTVWQLAGDLLPDATEEQILATGFCRNHMINGEGGRIAEENRVEYVMDMTETMGTVWLGLTLNCCRCHDHKYDPIKNKEYYQFFSFFNQTPVNGGGGDPQTAPVIAVPSRQQSEKLSSIDAEKESLDKAIRSRKQQLRSLQLDWEKAEQTRLNRTKASWRAAIPESAKATHADLKILPDRSVLVGGTNADNDDYTVRLATDLKKVTSFRVEALRDPSMTKNGLARSDSGNFVLTGLEISVDGRPAKIVRGEASFEQGGHVIGNVFDDNPKSGWAVYEGKPVDREHAAFFVLDAPVTLSSQSKIEIVLRHQSVHVKHNIGRFRVSFTDVDQPMLEDKDRPLRSALQTPPDKRSDEQKKRIVEAHLQTDPEYRKLSGRREILVNQAAAIRRGLPKVMVMKDMPMKEQASARKTFVLERGLYNKPADQVTSALPEFLPPAADSSKMDRLTLARWLVSDQQPLTARVITNRFWQQFFGIGLVKTSEDFGSQGEIPIHMDLLNWLAADFRDSGWDVKHLVRQIVTSHTYRQSSRISDPKVHEHDPDNRYLARGARYRMPSWMLRDQALAASGLLSPVVEGPAVNTYQPAGVWEDASFGKKKYLRDAGEKLYRRSLYTFWRRIIAPTMFFDNASRQTCTVRSGRTNTPLHALQTLNNVAYVEAARALAQLTLVSKATSDRERLSVVMKRLLARDASKREAQILLAGLERTRRQFRSDPAEAEKLVSVGESPRDESLNIVEHASWTALCSAVLNLDETLTRE